MPGITVVAKINKDYHVVHLVGTGDLEHIDSRLNAGLSAEDITHVDTGTKGVFLQYLFRIGQAVSTARIFLDQNAGVAGGHLFQRLLHKVEALAIRRVGRVQKKYCGRKLSGLIVVIMTIAIINVG